ncbi:class I SAM-dependent methyltransferase [Methanospirillum hungatei]|uniref:class I SAM-dependent methyltransferase n=1 Tax=Methanospirillum hungatei TaxID=2203 RepID=UPI0026EAB8AB|nr:class I SAM-dependent methyltransferase [Methanospirillum hungatei]MCA1915010.1 class I SAM-dependent methyltransferase [Methanospirillum hungatei]
MNTHDNAQNSENETTRYDRMDIEQARAFDETASKIFAPIYPVIARQILDRTKVSRGVALDAGCGPAHLSLALAQESELKLFAFDASPMMLAIAYEHITDAGLVKRVVPVLGDVHDIPFEDNSIDLIVSRGSWFFWDNLDLAFKEMYRVLSPGGMTFIGGGFGNAQLKKEIHATMAEMDPEFSKGVSNRMMTNNPDRIKKELEKAEIQTYDLIQDDSGFWLIIRK